MKRYGLFILSLIFLIVVTFFFVFFVRKRSADTDMINKKIKAVQLEMQRRVNEAENMNRRFLLRPQIPSLIENLYRIAEDNGLKKHDILSLTDKQSIEKQQRVKIQGIGVYPLNISVEGNYRDVAEYIRELQNITYLKKIRLITIMPEKGFIKADIGLDLYIRGADASQ